MSRRRSSALDQLLEKRKGEDASRVAAVDSDIHRLASFGILDVLKVQLEKRGVDVDAVDARNMTALLWGSLGYMHAAQMGNSPLHYAASKGVVGIITRLLDKGADAGLSNAQGTTPLMKAATNAQVATVKMLVNCNTLHYTTVSYRDTCTQHIAVLSLLAARNSAGADINKGCKQGNTALHVAARGGHAVIVKLLLHLAANPKVINKAGKTPKDVALDDTTAALLDDDAPQQ
eukprot:2972-Heterococcus_DN1.PRE.2